MKCKFHLGIAIFLTVPSMLVAQQRDTTLKKSEILRADVSLATAVAARAGKTGPESHSKYLTIWRLEPDGNWRYIFDIGSTRP
jgi:ketosteroid isomerase-like protein